MCKLIILVATVVGVLGHEKSLVMRHSAKMEDQRAAESGYLVKSDSKGPTSYMMFNSASGNVENFNYHPVSSGHYRELAKLPIPYVAKIDYPEQSELEEEPKEEVMEEVKEENKEVSAADVDDDNDDGGAEATDVEGYSEGDGAEHESEEQSSKGEKGSKGYKSEHAHKSAEKGKHEKEQHKGHYGVEGGNKRGHHEASGHYSEKDEAGKSTKGESFSDSKNHKKGSKTTGFHKVYHKDEYKKDHSFYDESDASGHYDKHGKSESHHSQKEGDFKKGGKSDAGYHHDQFGKKGSYDKGRHNSKDSGFKGEKGAEEFYNNYADFAKEGGKKGEKAYGYSEGAGKDD